MQLSVMLEWLVRLLPKQKMQDNGNGNVQAGHVEGGLHHSVVNNYNVQQINVDHNQLAIALIRANANRQPNAPDIEPLDIGPTQRAQRERARRPMPDYLRALPATPQQLELLALRRYSNNAKRLIDDFVEEKLNGKFIKELTDHEVLRAKRYVEKVWENQRIKEEVEGRPVWPDQN